MVAKLGQGLSHHQVARDLACAPSTIVEAARRFDEAVEEGLPDQRVFNGAREGEAGAAFGPSRFRLAADQLDSRAAQRGGGRSRPAARVPLRHGPSPLVERRTSECPGRRCSARGIRHAGSAFSRTCAVSPRTPPRPSRSSRGRDGRPSQPQAIGRYWMLKGERRCVVTPGQEQIVALLRAFNQNVKLNPSIRTAVVVSRSRSTVLSLKEESHRPPVHRSRRPPPGRSPEPYLEPNT